MISIISSFVGLLVLFALRGIPPMPLFAFTDIQITLQLIEVPE